MSNLGYSEAITRLLPNVLSYMIQQNILDQGTANRMFSTKEQWGMQFIQSLGGQNVQESVFTNALMQFLNNYKNMFMGGGMGGMIQPQPSFGGMGFQQPMPSFNQPRFGGGGVPSFGMQQPVGVGDRAFGGFMNPINLPQTPATTNFFGDPNAKPIPTGPVVTVEPQPVQEVPQKKEYIPSWKNDNSFVVPASIDFDSVAISSFLFPVDGDVPSFTRYTISYPYVLTSPGDLCGFMNIINPKKDDYIADISHKAAIIIDAKESVVTEIVDCLKRHLARGSSEWTRLADLNDYLNTLPRGLYKAFESIIVERFNHCLMARIMHHKRNGDLAIRVTTVEAMLNFSPAKSSDRLARLVTIMDYHKVYTEAMKYTLKCFESFTISMEKEVVLQALRSSKGVDCIKNIVDIYTKGDEGILGVLENKTVIVYDTRTAVTNMEFNKSADIQQALDTRISTYRNVPTCVLDHVLVNMVADTSPLVVINTNGETIYCGWTSDQQFTYGVF